MSGFAGRRGVLVGLVLALGIREIGRCRSASASLCPASRRPAEPLTGSEVNAAYREIMAAKSRGSNERGLGPDGCKIRCD